MTRLPEDLTAERGLIFRATHIQNVPWILHNGLCCRTSTTLDPAFVAIGNAEIIQRRATVRVPIEPGGTLDDYVPFYFTPFSPMMYNIKTGHGGVEQRDPSEIAILFTSIRAVAEAGLPFVYTDRHALLRAALFFSDPARLGEAVDFDLLQKRDFRRDPDRPDGFERYEAEALVYKHLPVEVITGVICYSESARETLQGTDIGSALTERLHVRKGWYF